MDVISSFSGKYSFLSNFHPSLIRIPNSSWEYPTVEHFFQASKFPKHSEHHKLIQTASNPAQAKKLGRMDRSDRRPNWEKIKVGVMLAALNNKFSQPKFADLLADTKQAILIEGNTWGDTFWGQVLVNSSDSYAHGEGVGLNILGVLLMHVRQKNKGFKTDASRICGDY